MHGQIDLAMNMILHKFPYDKQNVTIVLTSWTLSTKYLELYPLGEDPNDAVRKAEHHFSEDIAWEIKDHFVSNRTM